MTMKFCKQTGLSLVVLLAGLSVVAQLSYAQQAAKPAVTQQNIGSWVVTCPANKDPAGPRCSAKMNMVDKNRNVEVMSWTLGFSRDGKFLMEIITPSDVLIQPGLTFAFDNSKNTKMPYFSCGLAGCLSRQTLSAALVDILAKSKTAKFTLATTIGKNITLALNLSQTSEALKAIGYAKQ